ncbi:MAG TPA: AMP-binding protein [Porticoccaceae bacterium]|nr:AMP-binding protein [Porticoccaceae bacterium]
MTAGATSLAERLLAEQSAGDRPALGDGTVALSRGALHQRLERLATLLAGLATRDGRPIALAADNGVDWILADLACQLADIPQLPLPGFFSPAQRRHALHQSRVALVLTDRVEDWRPEGGQVIASLPDSGLQLLRLADVTGEDGADPLPPGTGKITYTSGSTGAPKGVCLGNRQLLCQADALARRVALDRPRHLCLLPLPVLLENIAGVHTCLLAGGEVLAPALASLGLSGSSGLDPVRLTRAIDHHRPHSLILIPQMLTALVAAAEAGWRPPGSLAFVAVGGSRVAAGQILRARALGLPVYEGYGLSECASVVSLNVPGDDRPGSAGRPLPHLDVRVEQGEIVIAGNPFLGYVGEPASWGQGRIPSGDLGRLDSDGFLHLAGRRKNLLISSFGRNISPEWVESELLASPLIRDCVVVGDARPWLGALICPSAGVGDDAIADSIARCNRELPDYARVRAWHRLAAPLAAVPGLVTATGKPRRDAIHAHFKGAVEALYTPLDRRPNPLVLPEVTP